MVLPQKIINSGVTFVTSKAEKRNIRLTNSISLLATFAVVFLLTARLWRFNEYHVFVRQVFSAITFLIPLLLNRFGFVVLSRLVLCWLPTVIIFTLSIIILQESASFDSSNYVGLRILLLIPSCIPFLVFSVKPTLWLTLALLSPLLSILLFDPIFNFFGVGYWQVGLREGSYDFNNIRAFVAFIFISGSCFFLKRLVEKGDEQNEFLIRELAVKNQIIQKQANEQLQEAFSRLALATQSAGIGIWELDIKTDEVIWDEQMQKLFGVKYKLNRDIDWKSYLHPDYREEVLNKLNKSIKNGEELSAEFCIILPEGNIRHLFTFGKVYYNQNSPTRMIGVCRDITERKLTEEQLIQSKAKLYATINNTTFFVWSINSNYQILYINEPFKSYIKDHFGLNINEGQSISELSNQEVVVDEFSESWLRNYKLALAGESFDLAEERLNRHFKYSLTPIIENGIVLGVSIFGEEITQLKRKERELAQANKQIGELKLVALRSVMNPHFIFNTLNSIQYFIMENDQVNAINYLSTFSKLIRSILNNSINNKVKLSEELEQLNHYVNLELLRFENKFDFILDIDPELDAENIEIPSMLLQPYVENAILHGLYNKIDHGTLKVSVKEVEQSVLFEIEDDGVGRKAAMKFRQQNFPKHKSMGTLLTEERLKLINAENDTSLEIIDLETEGRPTGTKVKIWIKE